MYERVCECGTAFETANSRKKRCRPNCGRTSASRNKVRDVRREVHDVRFMAVDGEADTTVEGDPYVLLSVGSEVLHKGGEVLTHHEIFPFLWEQHLSYPDYAFVGYFLGYDFSQFLKSISLHEAKMLLTPEGIAKRARRGEGASKNAVPWPVYIGDDWEIDLLGMKRFKIRPGKAYRKKDESWMYICDVGPFFATSFLNAIDPKNWPDEPVCSEEEYAVIREGKGNRDAAAFGAEMIRYNLLENEVLERMMGRLNKGYTAIDVRLSKQKWFGPGQAAQAWMGGTDVPTSVDVQECTPLDVLTMARDSYYGGWFEIFAHGHVPGKVYEYDINSAYPHIMRSLPCLLHGEWTEGKEGDITLVEAMVYGDDPYVGAIQHRTDKQTILRPGSTIGTYWLAELEAAKRAGTVSVYEVVRMYGYKACSCLPPLRNVAGLYNQRLEVGKNTVHGKACKGTYNSMYGKLAQSQGMPKFANPIYASLITSGCRTMILDAIATHPVGTADLVMVATDGVYFRSPHPGLELDGSKLGAWDEGTVTNLTLLMPGVYWSDKDREAVKNNQGLKLKSRGISARDLAERMGEFDTLFSQWKPGKEWPQLTIPIAFQVTGPKVALARNAWDTCGRSVRDANKTISSNPFRKRDTGAMEYRGGAWCSKPYAEAPGGELRSMPYRKEFGMDGLGNGEEIMPDGDIPTILKGLWSR